MERQLKQLATRAFSSIRSEFYGVLGFLAVVWGAFLVDLFLPAGYELRDFLALWPKHVAGLPGIATMHFLHRDLSHILANTFPLLVLITLMAGSRANTAQIVAAVMLISGSVLWLVGSSSVHYIGASVLVFGLIGFLVAAGIFERRPISMIISIVVGFMYGWSFLMGIIPLDSQVSELSHFIGGLTGVLLAFLTTWRPAVRVDNQQLTGPEGP